MWLFCSILGVPVTFDQNNVFDEICTLLWVNPPTDEAKFSSGVSWSQVGDDSFEIV
jgi:hypothetical protein